MRLRRLHAACLLALAAAACTQDGQNINLQGQDVRLTVLHTSDWHSRLLPYDMDVLLTDQNLGLDPDKGPYGGITRLAYLIARERANAGRSIYVDSGDLFQGAPIFNAFQGEVEYRAMSLLRPDAVAVGNHEFDNGLANLINQARNFANFPLLACNYYYVRPSEPGALSLGDITRPFTVVDVQGLKIGIIGVGNFSSLSSIGFADNSLDLIPMDMAQSVQYYIDLLQPQVNLIIAVSHAGLDEDQALIHQTVGLDMVFGGHLHIVLNPPREVQDASGRDVLLCHSGAFLKYLGRLDVVLRGRADDPHDFEVISHQYQVFPIDSTVPEDPAMSRLIEPYVAELRRRIDVSRVLGYAPRRLRRFGDNGGDSEVGNFVADTMRRRRRVETDFAVTNSLGIRSDIVQGPIILDQTYNIFPFPNTITTMTLSGNEIQEMLDFNAQRSASRGCATQLQVSGISFTMDCSVYPAVARDIKVGGQPILPNHFYTMATNDYLSHGGSGFRVLRFNSTQQDTGVAIRDAVNDEIEAQPTCLSLCEAAGDTPDTCDLLKSCRDDLGAYDARACTGLDNFSDQAVCLDEQAPSCLELSDQSDFDICRHFADPACDQLYTTDDREACYAAAEVDCQGENQTSPRAQCATDQGADSCLNLDPQSEYATCVDLAHLDAEDLCMTIGCMQGYTDGRISRILPSNEFVPSDQDTFIGGDVGAALMEEMLQSSPENDEACY